MEQQELRRLRKEAVEKERARVEQDRERARREDELDKTLEQTKEKEGRIIADVAQRWETRSGVLEFGVDLLPQLTRP